MQFPSLAILRLVYHGIQMLQSESDLSLGSKAMAPIFTMAQIAAFPLICAYLDFVLVIYFPSTNYHFVPCVILLGYILLLISPRAQDLYTWKNVSSFPVDLASISNLPAFF
jgi:hypothetical protein